MSTFFIYFNLGLRHIANINGVEHLLFLIALCSIYLMRDWKKVLFLILYYTVGHSLTLFLSTYHLVFVPEEIINYLIPLTIFLTAGSNIFKRQFSGSTAFQTSYLLALIFGMIHGFGFGGYLKQILGNNTSIGFQLFSFNMGIEVGQILVVFSFLLLSWIFVNNLGINRRDWNLVISAGIAGIALTNMFESRFWIQ